MPGKKRKYFSQQGKNSEGDSLAFGIPEKSKGFLCTCSGFEKDAVREVYRLLEQFASGSSSKNDDEEEENDDDGDGGDLEKELEELRKERKRGGKKFQQFKIKARGVIFIRLNDQVKDEPEVILSRIFDDFEKNEEKQCRALSRVLPIHATCKAHPETVLKCVTEMISEKFGKVDGAKTYSVEVNKRNNDNELRIVSKITQFVRENHPSFRTEPKNPNVMISVEVVAASCFVSVVENYAKFRKFKMSSFGENVSKKAKNEEGAE